MFDYVLVKEQKIPVVADVDVLIAGGGCAGVGAAIAAGRDGARTVLIERMFYLGGTMTGGLMSKIAIAPWNRGLAAELLERMDQYQGTAWMQSRPEVPVDPELAKLLLDKMVVDEAGVDVRFGTVVSDVIREGREIKAVIISNIKGLQAIRAKYFIDCTGDGQLGFLAGAAAMIGSDDGGLGSAPTLMFRIAHVDVDKFIDAQEKDEEEFKSARTRHSPQEMRERYHAHRYIFFVDYMPFIKRRLAENPAMFSGWEQQVLTTRGLIFINQPQDGVILVNSTRILKFRGNDDVELSSAMVAGRRQIETIFRFMKNFFPGFEQSIIMDTGSLLGIRESRRIEGDYVFTERDISASTRFWDAVVSNNGGIEIHSPTGFGLKGSHLGKDEFYHVPYRSIIARDFNNLFMAGRCFSANHPGLSAARNIAYCIALGQAAGSAGAQLAKNGKTNVREIDIGALQEKLGDVL
ncbi:hypothetical protein AGMMS49587_19130 [Spirochaetia bacterium]|nr:hypothetical protein AGMMS49587_19130 [Spirochaetia bacterium]